MNATVLMLLLAVWPSQTQIIFGGGWDAGLCESSHTMNAATLKCNSG